MLKHISPREKKLALAVAAVALAFVGYNFLFLPLLHMKQDMDQRIRAAEAKLLKSLRVTHQAAQINEEFDKLSPVHQFRGTDQEMISTLLRSVESLARNAGVTITDIKPRMGQENPTHKKYLIEMDTEASMPALFRLLQDLEGPQGFFTVLKMNLTPKGRDSKTLRAYILISRTLWT